MRAWRLLLLACAILSVVPALGFGVRAQQTFPTTAFIRGENIWLRVEPAQGTDVRAYLQRGDAVTITGEAVAADGETFVPVEVDATGETGWVRELAIDPRSLPQSDVGEAVQREPRQPRAEREPIAGGETATRERPRRRDANASTRRESRPPRAERTPAAVADTPTPEEPRTNQVNPEPEGTCDPSYPYVCVPPPPPDLNCGSVPDNIIVVGDDPHRFDGNNDGVGCET